MMGVTTLGAIAFFYCVIYVIYLNSAAITGSDTSTRGWTIGGLIGLALMALALLTY